MKIQYCWRCGTEVPMLDEREVRCLKRLFWRQKPSTKWSWLSEFWHKISGKSQTPNLGFNPMILEYERITGHQETDAGVIAHHVISHHRLSNYGPPCPSCGKPLRTAVAKLCPECGWKRQDHDADQNIQTVEKQKTVFAKLVESSVSEYCQIVQGIPLPTSEQKNNFADFVAHAHSWYKHLPWYPPGAPFLFYIDRNAGCYCVVGDAGEYKFIERTKNGFHYSDIPTNEYRKRFGYLAYSHTGAVSVVADGGKGPIVAPNDKSAEVSYSRAQKYRLPPEIFEAGSVGLTCVIHTYTAQDPYWIEFYPKPIETIDWPEESGGRATLEKIFARCQVMGDPAFVEEDSEIDYCVFDSHSKEADHLYGADPVLNALLYPERKRQYGEMVKAMDRVCGIIETYRHS